MSAHRALRDLFRAFEANGPGVLNDPGDAGSIEPTGYGQICELVTTGAETRTLAAPTKAGIRFHLRMTTDGGDCVVTASVTLNETGNTVATFNAVGESLDLISVTDASVIRWDIVVNTGSVGLA